MDVLFLQAPPNRCSNSDSFQLGVWILALFGEPLAEWEFKYDFCGSENAPSENVLLGLEKINQLHSLELGQWAIPTI